MNDENVNPNPSSDPEKAEDQEGEEERKEEAPAQKEGQDEIAEEEKEEAQSAPVSREIFVVLSQREDINKDCLETIAKHDLKPVILNDNPDDMRSIAEIFKANLQVAFALIILAGDDFRYDRLTGKPGEAFLYAKPDAIFLLGYLLAKFGNSGTMTVYREQKSFRFPIGQHHTAFVPYQKGGNWKEIFESKLRNRKIL